MAPIPPSYGKGPSCDLVVDDASRATSAGSAVRAEPRQWSQEISSSSCRTSTSATSRAATAIASRSRRTSTRWRRAARASPTPTRHARSACRPAPRWRPGDGCTRPRRGTTPRPITAKLTSWHHRLRDNGHRVVSIGKLHFRATADDNGFSEEILPLHVLDGMGDLIGMLREPPAAARQHAGAGRERGPGELDLQRLRSARSRRRRADGSRSAGEPRRRQALGAVRVVRAAALSADARRPNSTSSIRRSGCRCPASMTRRTVRAIPRWRRSSR